MATPTITFKGFVYDDAGAAISGATINLYDKNDVATSRASTTTNSSGYWTIAHTTNGEFDVQVTSGSSKRRIKFDDSVHLSSIDTQTLAVRGANGAAANMYLYADRGDTAGDAWRWSVADGGVVTFDNNIADIDAWDTYLTLTPHATVASSSVTIAGILDVNGSIDADVSDLDVASSGDIDLVSTNDAVGAIYLRANAGTSETVKIHADQGTSVTEGAESVTILSDAGGVGIRSTANLANAVNITADGGTTSSITVFNDQGTSVTEGAESIALLSDAGGIGIRSTANLASAVNVTVDGGTTSSITLFNDQGTSVTEGAESIALLSDAGGIGIRSTANLANAVNITVDGGTSSTLTLFNDQGTAATEGAASIQLLSDVGGVNIKSGLNGANAILLTADAGTSETIVIHSDQGTGASSIKLLSDAGGIELAAATSAITMTGPVLIDSTPADETVSGIIASFTAGEALERGEVVYFKAADSKMWKAVAAAGSVTPPCVAMAAADIAADAAGNFLLQGFLADNGTFPAYTIAGTLYTPEAEEGSQNVPEQAAPADDGDLVQILGWAVTANSVYFRPDSTIVEVA